MKKLVLMEESTYRNLVNLGASEKMQVTNGTKEFLREHRHYELTMLDSVKLSEDIIEKVLDKASQYIVLDYEETMRILKKSYEHVKNKELGIKKEVTEITEDEFDDLFVCHDCGNTVCSSGFYTCDEYGDEMEADIGSDWKSLYVCGECEKVYKIIWNEDIEK